MEESGISTTVTTGDNISSIIAVVWAQNGNESGSGNGTGSQSGTGTETEEGYLGYQIVTSLLLAALILFAALGNACVIAAIALERSLQNVANYLIGSLAVTDLMVSVLVLPMAALYQVLDKWTLGQVMCDIFIALDVLCCTSSILHLCAIALDRYWAITDPIDYVNKRTPRRAAVLISLTWLVGFSISIPPMLGWRKPEDRDEPDACKISQDPGYTVYSTFGAFYIPLVLMLVLYGRIFRAARFRIRKTVKKTEKAARVSVRCPAVPAAPFHRKTNGGDANRTWRRSVEPQPEPCANGADRPGQGHGQGEECEESSLETIEVYSVSKNQPYNIPHLAPAGQSAPGSGADARRKTALARERKTVKTLGIIMGTFILCWLPFFIVALVLPFCQPRCLMPPWLGAVINWLGYSNSLLNPVIYAYYNKDFQNAFKKILKCKFARR